MTTTLGEQLRLDGIEANLAAATATHRTYRDHAERALTELAKAGEPFTADDVRARIPRDVEPHHPNVLPSLLGQWAAQGRISAVDWHTSPRPSRHSSRNRVWIGSRLTSCV